MFHNVPHEISGCNLLSQSQDCIGKISGTSLDHGSFSCHSICLGLENHSKLPRQWNINDSHGNSSRLWYGKMRKYIHTYIYICVCVIYIYTHTWYIYIYVCVCMYVYVCVHIHAEIKPVLEKSSDFRCWSCWRSFGADRTQSWNWRRSTSWRCRSLDLWTPQLLTAAEQNMAELAMYVCMNECMYVRTYVGR